MSYNEPDNWVVVKLTHPNNEIVYKVLAGWSGGYLYGDSWRLNSGIVKVERDGNHFLFHGASGSIYRCHPATNRLSMSTAGIYNQLVNNDKEIKVDMAYYYNDPSQEEPKFMTEEEILESYWDFWKDKMVKKYGEGHKLITKDNCIEDWITVNWAWKEEDTIDGKQ